MRTDNCSVEDLLEHLRYTDEGRLYWLKSGTGRRPTLEAGSLHKASGSFKLVFKGKQYAVHRVVWAMNKGYWPDQEIDHIDGDETNNKIENLRLATGKQNCVNRPSRKGSTSKYRGVYKPRNVNRWCACIGKEHLGTFSTEEEAAMAYNIEAITRYGEFARPNKIEE